MTISVSISNIIDNILADSAIAHRAEENTMLTRDNSAALTRLARIAFAEIVMKINSTGLVSDFDDGSDGDNDVMSIEVEPICPTTSQNALLTYLELALTMRILAMTCTEHNASYTAGVADAVASFIQVLGGSRPSRIRAHWC